MKDAKHYWDDIWESAGGRIVYDDWLDRFLDAIDACDTPIIDLGCGSGNDTLYLMERGKTVIPCDLSPHAIRRICERLPGIERAECFDMANGLPFEDDFAKIIIADLSLHYFSEEVTRRVLREIARVLKKDGLLLFRVNSIDEPHDGDEIEHHFFLTTGSGYKRFFDEADVRRFFADWDIQFLREEIMNRYAKPKHLFRGAARPITHAPPGRHGGPKPSI